MTVDSIAPAVHVLVMNMSMEVVMPKQMRPKGAETSQGRR